MKVGTVIIYSSIDSFLWKWMKPLAEAVSDDLIVVRKTHLFNGDPEPLPDLGVPTLTMPHVDATNPGISNKVANQMRYAGIAALHPECTHYLLLDGDELFEPDRMKAAFKDYDQPQFFHARWYWRDANHCAVQDNECGAWFGRSSHIIKPHDGVQGTCSERSTIGGPKHYLQRGIGRGNPFCHHFSWAKPLDVMLKKVTNWGHKKDRTDWVENLRREWAQPHPSLTEFVHGKPVVPCSNPLGVVIP